MKRQAGTDSPRKPAAHGYLSAMDALNRGLVWLCGVGLMVMVACVTLGILVRFVFSHTSLHISAPWTEEVSRYIMIWTVFLGAAVAARSGKLIGVEALMLVLPAPAGRLAKYLAHATAAGFYVLLCGIGAQWLEFGRSQTSPVLQVPLAAINMAMMAGGALLLMNTAALVLEARLARRDIRHATQDDEVQSALAQLREEPR